jgi:solute carrier family 8 (sodium/calcium exchanger)
VSCRYRTKEGSAEKGKDYVHTEGQLEFKPNEQAAKIQVKIIDDVEWEKAEDFYVEIFGEQCSGGTVIIGPNNTTTVTIIDDDDPGTIAFEKDTVTFAEEATHGEHETMKVKVVRYHGSKGDISCKMKTEDDTAMGQVDYVPLDETLELKAGEMAKDIPIKIKKRGRCESVETFRIVLSEPKGCRFQTDKGDGDEEHQVCTIEIKANEQHKQGIMEISAKMNERWAKSKIGYGNWQEQFIAAVYVGGSPEDQKEATAFEWVLHLLSLPFTLLFALVPPTDFCGGWMCFCVALVMIGGITAAVGDLAMLFGCCLGLPNEITAITFVALGTSLPDTFASRSAAMQDPYADASITNITGSNSVNVFLGLGLPWTFAAVYWAANGPNDEYREKIPLDIQADWAPDAIYVLEADSLGFSVGVFTAAAIAAIAALWVRRGLYKGELGGPKVPKIATTVFLVFLWCGYIAASWIYKEVNGD